MCIKLTCELCFKPITDGLLASDSPEDGGVVCVACCQRLIREEREELRHMNADCPRLEPVDVGGLNEGDIAYLCD